MIGVAVAWELWLRTRSPLALGAVGLAQVVPVIALFAPAGMLVDRFDRRRMAAVSAALGAASAAALMAASMLAAPTLIFYVLLFLRGCAIALQSPATSALLPALVEREQLASVNAVSSSALQLGAIAGPALAGGILVVADPAVCYAVAAAGAAIAGAMFLSLKVIRAPDAPARVVMPGGWLSGLRFLVRSRRLLPALVLDMFAVLFAGVTALLPIFAESILHAGPAALGAMRAAPALGAMVMAIGARWIPPWKRPGRVLLVVVTAYGVATMAFGLSRSLPLSVFLLALGGALDNISVVIRITLEQLLVPDPMRGRVSAVHFVFIGLSNELGELESGVAAALLGAVPAVVVGGAVAIVVAALVAWRAPALRELPPLSTLQPEPA